MVQSLLTSVAKYTLEPSEVAQVRLILAKQQNVTTLHSTELLRIETSHTTAKLQLKALAEGCPQLATVIGC
jgi:hypothetical protein